MRISIPTEVKDNEFRVAITPVGVAELVAAGHEVAIQAGAGTGSSISDEDYAAQGATIVGSADEVWERADLLLKVKEPVADEYRHLREDLTLFTYLHLAADRPLTDALVESRATAIAYETVQLPDRSLPLLIPMSEVAGCLAPQMGAHYLTRAAGGRGVLMGHVTGVEPAKVVVLGCGAAGAKAALAAAGLGADVTVLDTDMAKLRHVSNYMNVQTLASSRLTVREQVLQADLVIGTVLLPGSRTPRLVTHEMVTQMKPGSVLVDVAIDQGGCFEDSHPTTHEDPVFQVEQSTFYCVGNMPGAVPNTSTWALTNSTLPYIVRIANLGWQAAMQADPALAKGLNVQGGRIVYPGVAQAFDLPHTPVDEALAG
ncbi:alanine dehydrogenase [Luteococcus sp. Sow4_B9]|uniref:alanine dehydrogenase n=1 Tax=Luteococcus sp. Sow4_B9 TaxID=3438792 RepID=UPI003F99D534